MNWQQEMRLLNDDQLGRIAYAEKDSWGYYYYPATGQGCCVYGHALELNAQNVVEKMHEVYVALGIEVYEIIDAKSPLEEYYQTAFLPAFPYPKLELHPEIIEEIQNYAKQLLEERKQRVAEPETIKVINHE